MQLPVPSMVQPRILRAWPSTWLLFYPSGFHRSVANTGRGTTLHSSQDFRSCIRTAPAYYGQAVYGHT